jgi:hypothetical protein
MTPQSEPKPEAGNDRSEYERTGQHGPEMDDTQVAATEGRADGRIRVPSGSYGARRPTLTGSTEPPTFTA